MSRSSSLKYSKIILACLWVILSLEYISRLVAFMVIKTTVWLIPSSYGVWMSTFGQTLVGVIAYMVALAAVVYPLSKIWPRSKVKQITGVDLYNLSFSRIKNVQYIKSWRWKNLLFIPVAFGVYFALSTFLNQVAEVILPWYNSSQNQENGFLGITHLSEYILAFISLIIVAPIVEEIIFRGFLFGYLRRNLSFITSAIIVSSLFGAVHGQWNVAVDVFALSLVACFLREKTGSIWLGVLLHAAKNLLAYVFLFIVKIHV